MLYTEKLIFCLPFPLIYQIYTIKINAIMLFLNIYATSEGEIERTLKDIDDAFYVHKVPQKYVNEMKDASADLQEALYEVAQNYDCFEALIRLAQKVPQSLDSIVRKIKSLQEDGSPVLEIISQAIKISPSSYLIMNTLENITPMSVEERKELVKKALKLKQSDPTNYEDRLLKLMHKFK